MAQAKYKIVDTFNGGEFGRFVLKSRAETELGRQRKRFYSHLGNQNVIWKRVIVPSNYEWRFNHRLNRWEWAAI